jgi:hypothetical protein
MKECCFDVQLLDIPRSVGSNRQEGSDSSMFGYMGIGFIIINPFNLPMTTSYKASFEAVKFTISISFDSVYPFARNNLHKRFLLY